MLPPSTSHVVRRFADLAVEGLAAAREEIDALNVYPVPDGDTGTNMFLTVESARDAMVEALAGAPGRPPAGDARLRAGCPARCPGQLRRHPQPAGRRAAPSDRPGRAGRPVGGRLRRGHGAGHRGRLRRGRDSRSRAPSCPSPGPPPRRLRRRREVPDDRLGDVVRAAASAAREALARTPEQLPLLAQAGVVDAGGRGLCVVLDAAESAITGKRATTTTPHVGTPGDPGRAGSRPVTSPRAGRRTR